MASAPANEPNPWADVALLTRKARIVLLLLVIFAYLLLFIGVLSPLIEFPMVWGTPARHTYEFGSLANAVVALAAIGGVFFATKSPRGVLASGVGIVALIVLLPLQVAALQVSLRLEGVSALFLGGSLLAAAGVTMSWGKPRQRSARSNQYSHGVMSLWLGWITDEEKLQTYLSNGFVSDFGFEIGGTNNLELDASPETQPIDALLTGFTGYENFLDAAGTAAQRSGWTEANCAVVIYDFRLQEGFVRAHPEVPLPLSYVGSYNYQTTKDDIGLGQDKLRSERDGLGVGYEVEEGMPSLEIDADNRLPKS
jgi:hypothetical protein